MSEQPWLIVMRREISAKLRDKAFLFSTGSMLLMIAIALGVQAFLGSRTQTFDIAVTPDARPMVERIAAAARAGTEPMTIRLTPVPDGRAARASVLGEKTDAWLHEESSGWVLSAKSEPDSDLTRVVSATVAQQVLAANAEAAGTTIVALTAGSAVTPQALDGSGAAATLRQVLGFVFAFLFYVSALIFGLQLAQSVLEEKQSRVVEIIATSIPLRQLLAGKILGNTALALGQMVLYAGVGLIGLSFTSYGSYIGQVGGPIGWFLVFFVAGFSALACLWAVAGALASRAEDLQATTTPLTTIVMAVFFGALLLKGKAAAVAAFVPPISAVAMPMRVLSESVPLWQPVVALLLLLAFAGATILLGERIYRRSLLQTRGRVTLKQAWQAED